MRHRVGVLGFFVDTPGATSNDLSRFTYRNRPVPLYPFDDPDPTFAPRRPTP